MVVRDSGPLDALDDAAAAIAEQIEGIVATNGSVASGDWELIVRISAGSFEPFERHRPVTPPKRRASGLEF